MNCRRVLQASVVCLIPFGFACSESEAKVATTDSTDATTSTTSITPTTSATTSTTIAEVTMAAFAAAADATCAEVFPKVMALEDSDGVGGQKQIGLGQVVREWAEQLAALTAPSDIAVAWAEATNLLRQSGVKLEESEAIALETGDPNAGGPAQSEALWDLQPRAAEIILELDIPFLVCTFG